MIVNQGQLWFVISEAVLAGTALWIAVKFMVRGSAAHWAFAGGLVLTALAAIAGGIRVGMEWEHWAGLHQMLVNLSGTAGFVLMGAGALEAAHKGMIMASGLRAGLCAVAVLIGVGLVMFGDPMPYRPVFFVAAVIAGILSGAILSGRGNAPAALMMVATFVVMVLIMGAMMAGLLASLAPGYDIVLFHFIMAVWCVMVLRTLTLAIPKARTAENEPWQVLE